MINICKFTQTPHHSPLSTSLFVMEADEDTMRRHATLSSSRMILAVKGSGYFNFDTRRIAFKVGYLFFAFEGEVFSVSPDSETAYIYIDFSGGRAIELLERFDIHKGNRCFEKCDGLIPLWRESLTRARADTIDLAAESMVLYTFSRLLSSKNEQNDLIGKILKITEENFDDPEMSISKIAEMLSYNSKYLSHAFKKAMDLTYCEYLRDMRIRYAISLFDEGIDSVKNVAVLSGFSDPLYFSNVFKKITGRSPREYIISCSKDTKR